MASKGGKSNPGKGNAGKRGGRSTPSGMSVSSGGGAESVEDRKARRAEAVAAMKREQARRQTRSRLLMASGVVVAVLIVVAAVVFVGLNHSEPASATGRQAASASVAKDVTSVPAATFDKIGVGDAIAAPKATGVTTPLTEGGKASVLYVGAEYCPYCAAERWAIAASLARFGTFSGLKETASSSTDVHPDTQTLSFFGATYTSDYVDFKAVETETSTGKPLETLSGDDLATEKKYNFPPYVSGQGGSIPFVDIANQYVSSGATLDATVLEGKSHAEIAAALLDPDSKIARAVDGAANLFTAAICDATGGKPGDVCTSSGVQTAAKSLTSAAK